jgi:hypothetical protein
MLMFAFVARAKRLGEEAETKRVEEAAAAE